MTARAKPSTCDGCPCRPHGTDFSAIEGTGANGVMLVGEASGEHEQRDLLPFRPYAPAGGVLTRIIRRMGQTREAFSITNVGRCRPRNNWLEGAPWEFAALAHCRPNLEAAIAERRPRAIVALGGVATRELTGMAGEAQGVGHLAGYVLPYAGQTHMENRAPADAFWLDRQRVPNDGGAIPVIPNFHPAYLRRGKASHQGVFARILQRAANVAAGRDREWMWNVDPEVDHAKLGYETHPSLDAAEVFARRVGDNPLAVLSYDIETIESASLDEDAREGFVDTSIRLVQFHLEGAGAIALPWDGAFRKMASGILCGPNPKCGHNVWLFDNKVLRAAGEREGLDLTPRGVIHDTLQMFHHWQPDLPAHLQFAASYVQFPFPWKHLASGHIEFYGCCDVDATLRLYGFLRGRLEAEGLWGTFGGPTGYLGQVAAVRPVLAAMEDRGLPVDDAERLRLDAEFDRAQRALGAELAEAAPVACRRVHPKGGYKGVPPEVKAWLMDIDPAMFPDGIPVTIGKVFQDSGPDGARYTYHRRDFPVPVVDAATGEPATRSTARWCRVYDFNPNSSQQLLAYMKAKGHKPPKSRKNEDAEGNAKDTTEKKELVRLAHRTGDSFYLRVIEYREFSKMRGTYIEGFAPGPDGRVHATFTFDTGTGQLAARNPNVTNFPKRMRLAKQVRRMVAAPKGYLLAETDYKSYHVMTTGFCAEDASYCRLARLDMHSFVGWHMLGLPGADSLIALPDDELAAKLAWFKSDPARKFVRDNQSKPAILGIGFGMGYRRLYQENMEYFDGEKQAKRLHDLLRRLFPRVFAWQDRVRKEAHERRMLVSPFGHVRRFYEVFRWDARKGDWAPGDQADEAVAFLPANIAFGNIRETMKRLKADGLDERFGLVDHIHDSFVWCFPAGERDAFLDAVPSVLETPSAVLRNPVAPDGLVVGVETHVGPNWAEMEEVKLPCRTTTATPPRTTVSPVAV